MDLDTYFRGSRYQVGTLANVLLEKNNANSFYKNLYNEDEKNSHMGIAEFLDIQKKAQLKSEDIVSYLDKKGYSVKSLGEDTATALNNQINSLAALQAIQNFYDMYISPMGTTDIKYRLGEVTGRAIPGTVNNQTDSEGRMTTRSLRNQKISYRYYTGTNFRTENEYYSAIWFPPYKPISVKPTSWYNLSYDPSKKNNIGTTSLADYIAISKEKRQAELDRKNERIIENGGLPTETEAEDTRLLETTSVDGESKYYDTFDLKTFKAARSSFTYRTAGFKAINDNINMLQWLLEGVSGIVSTYLTEWDISLYLQEGLISDSEGTLPNTILLTHRLEDDNPSGYLDERAATYGVVNCAVSKIKNDNIKTWDINAYPYSSFYTPYPDPNTTANWTDKIDVGTGDYAYVPNFYKFGKEGYTAFLAGKDMGWVRRPNTLQTKLTYQDFENAALSGYEDWKFNNKIYKALYTSDDDGFSDIDTVYLSTSVGLYKKRDLIDQVCLAKYGVTESGTENVDGVTIATEANASGTESTYTWGNGDGGNKYTPASVFKGALTFLSMFKKKDSAKAAALSQANSMNNSDSGNIYGAMQDSLGLTKQASSGIKAAQSEDPNGSYLLGTDKCLTDNSNGVGVPQNNPTLYGGPHGFFRSPKSWQAYYQENSTFLRNIPRVDALPDNFNTNPYDDTWNNTYYKGNEKWCSRRGESKRFPKQQYEQSWSAGLAKLKQGIHTYAWVPCYIRAATYTTVEATWRWPSHAPNGEAYHYYGSWWWELRTRTVSRSYGYSRYNYSSRYSGGSYYVTETYLVRRCRAWYYSWQYSVYKRYMTHNEPDLNWNIVKTQHYYSTTGSFALGFWNYWWPKVYAKLFKLTTPIMSIAYRYGNEEYELNVPGGGYYNYWGIWDARFGRSISLYQTWNEHNIMTKMVDWSRGVGASNKIMFLTRDGQGNPDCLFRCIVTHKVKPVYYWCEHWRKYSSRKCKHWWERHNGWKHYLAVDIRSTDRFIAGISRPSFTPTATSNQFNHEDLGYFEPPINGIVSRENRLKSIFTNNNSCKETRRTVYDLTKGFWSKSIPRYEPSTSSDSMIGSANGISGRGILGDIPGLDYSTNDGSLPPTKAYHTIRIKSTNWNQCHSSWAESWVCVDGRYYYSQGRGHTLYKIALNSGTVSYVGHWDTYGNYWWAPNSLASAISNIGSGYIIALISWDATSSTGQLVNALRSVSSNYGGWEWRRARYSNAFLGIRGKSSPYARISAGNETSPQYKFDYRGFISEAERERSSFPEDFDSKTNCQQSNKYNIAFKNLQFPLYKITYFDNVERSYNGNTYRVPGGYPHYTQVSAPSWWNKMIINIGLRNTFYRSEDSAENCEVSFKQFSIDTTGLSEHQIKQRIYNLRNSVNYDGGKIDFAMSDIYNYTTFQKQVIVDGIKEDHDFVDIVYIRDVIAYTKYYFTSFDLAPKFVYGLLNRQLAYLNVAKDLFCSKIKNKDGQSDYVLSFESIKRIIEGDATTDGLISPRTYYLSNPTKKYVKDPDGKETINNEKVTKCEDVYGYNPFIVSAREWFCNDKATNTEKHQQLENAINNRISWITNLRNNLSHYLSLNIKDYSWNTMISCWRLINSLASLKHDDEIEDFFLSYLNVLYESRRWFVNKRFNKQDGTMWACRHLEKMIPQVIASAVSSGANVQPGAFSDYKVYENVAFYEVQNTLGDKVNVVEDRANDASSTETLGDDRIKTVYVKVRYATKEAYESCQEKLKNRTLKETDEVIVKVKPWSYIKKKDGTFKKKSNNDVLSIGETWNSSGYAIKYGKIKYAIKPEDGLYQLLSKEYKINEENKEKLKNNPNTAVSVKDYDEAKWEITWGDELGKTPIVYNLYGGTNIQTIMDLTKAGVTDPIEILCGAKQSSDYWKINVGCAFPKSEGYKSQITLEKRDYINEEYAALTESNALALQGESAYAMWPIIEEQEDVIPNAGDLAQSLFKLSTQN